MRDFTLGSNFPTVKDFELKKVEMSNDKDVIQVCDVDVIHAYNKDIIQVYDEDIIEV